MKVRYEHQDFLEYYKTDQNKYAKASGILQITQKAGNSQMERDRPTYDEITAQGKAFMLSRLDFEVYEPIVADEMYTISSWACEGSRATFPRNYSIERDGKTLVMVSSYWVLVDIESRKLLKVDDVNIDNYYIGEFVELYKDKLKVPRDLEFEEVGKKEIMYCDLDTNGHMNNTYYMDVVSNYIPELPAGTHRIKSVRLHYSKEAPFGDTITIFRAKVEEGKYLFKTVKENGEMNIACEVGLVEL